MVEIVRENPDLVGFAVDLRRWVVERFFACIGRNRTLAKDFEATIDSARAFLYAAFVMLLTRRIAPCFMTSETDSQPRPAATARNTQTSFTLFKLPLHNGAYTKNIEARGEAQNTTSR